MSETNQPEHHQPEHSPPESTETRSPKRRRRLFIGLGVAAVVLMVAAPMAMAHRGWGRHKVMTPEVLKERADRVLDKAMSKLDGTDAQRASLDRIVDDMIPEVIKWRTEGKRFKDEIKSILLADTIDRQALERVRKEALVFADQVSVEAFAALADAAETLTPEQRAEIADFIAKRHGHRR